MARLLTEGSATYTVAAESFCLGHRLARQALKTGQTKLAALINA
jgi:hypothetical protein